MTVESIQIEPSVYSPNNQEIKNKVRDIPVCFVMTPSPFLADERVFPFLGPLKVAAELKKNNNPVTVLDLSGYSTTSFNDILEEYVKVHPDTKMFALSATTPQLPYAVILSKEIKAKIPGSKVILGGPHATLTHAAYKQDLANNRIGRGTYAYNQLQDFFDTIVIGDGEMAIFHALNPEHQQQVIDAGNFSSDLFMKRGTLDEFEQPARELIDIDSYKYYIDGHRAFSVISQLGCPFKCGFCGGRDSQVFRMTRTRSNQSIIKEIEDTIKASITRSLNSEDPSKVLTGVMFYDDELNVTKNGLESLCKNLIALQEKLAIEIPTETKRKLGIKTEVIDEKERVSMRLRGFIKAELFTQEQANLMFEAGFREVLSGVESGSDLILNAMQKNTSRKINSRAVNFAHNVKATNGQNGRMKFKALMSIGHPGESKETILESIKWAKENLTPGDEIDWSVITQYPGSPYYDRSYFDSAKNVWVYEVHDKKTNQNLKLYSHPSDFTQDVHNYKGIPGNYQAYVFTDFLTSEELVHWRDFAENETRVKHLQHRPIEGIVPNQFEHSMGQGLPQRILTEHGNIYTSN